jgi:hypothetical protein
MELSSVWGWPIGSRAAIIESVGSLCTWRLAKPSRRDYDGRSGELSDRASGAPNVPLFLATGVQRSALPGVRVLKSGCHFNDVNKMEPS